MVEQDVKKLAKNFHSELIAIRRHLHQYPELSWKEKDTSDYIAQQLDKIGVTYTRGWAGHGIVAVLGKGKNCVALRADIDALPITERNNCQYKSKNEGVMHACGHDVHTTCLLGAIKILKQMEDHLNVQVKCIFQPAEELLPGGASVMIKEGVFDSPKPSKIFGLHVHPPLEVGKVGFHGGQYMASADEIRITVKGKGGHAAIPEDCIDPVIISANILVQLQQVISRKSSPLSPAVLSFGKINTNGGATNIIPNEVFIEGTFRAMDEQWRYRAHDLIKDIINSNCKAYGATAIIDIKVGYPSLFNDEKLTKETINSATNLLGKDNVVALPKRMSAEDFAFYSHEIPACFYRLGTGNIKKGIISPVHTDTFDVDEDCLLVGSALMAQLALEAK